MEFDHILIRYGELALKGKNIKQFLVRLQQNIQQKLKDFPNVKVRRTQGRMFVMLNGHDPNEIIKVLQNIFGIQSMSTAIKVSDNLEQIQQASLYALQESGNVKTFKIETRRVKKSFPIRSQEMNRELGAFLLKNIDGLKVDVHNPDILVRVEIRPDATYITSKQVAGLGGLPVGTAGKSLLLLSGGIDSPVAGYQMMKRGVEIEAIHFHSPPFTSERAKQKVLDLAEKLTAYTNKVRVHLVPFTELQQQIFKEIPDSYAMTVMRRMMMRIAEVISKKHGILSFTTGESLGQVASQTMESMHTIGAVTTYPILRPLVAMDKSEIIEISKTIDTYDISIQPYEDCCTIFVPKAPKTRPDKEKVESLEERFDFSPYIEDAIDGIETIEIIDEEESTKSFEDLL